MKKVALYSFTGNFCQNGSWSEPEIGFRGEFIARRDGTIIGYCDELYNTEESFKKRFIVGRFLDDGISFLKLTNSRVIAPILYSSRDIDENTDALWAPVGLSEINPLAMLIGASVGISPASINVLDTPSPASLTVTELEYSEEHEDKIRERFDELDTDKFPNGVLADHPELCKFLVEHDDDDDEEDEDDSCFFETDLPHTDNEDEES